MAKGQKTTKIVAKKKPAANKMWGGHFSMGPAEAMAQINECLEVDKRLYDEDITASQAHAAMLAAQGILTKKDADAIRKGLEKIRGDIQSGAFQFQVALEDIHMNVEASLTARIGPAAGRLHTARSRNDQVATDLRLWVRRAMDRVEAGLIALIMALLDQAEQNVDTLMPGFTHLQPAQPITFGHHMMAYVEMFSRDLSRFRDARRRMNECPLGAAALAGTSFPIDRAMTAAALGFDRPMANSLDAVSDRDYAMEFMADAAMAGIHLSRLAEEIVIWTSEGYRFVKLSEAFTTGSSIMPQKRNPDAAELIRGKSGSLIGALTQLLVLMKGLPLAYNKDMQDSKPPVMRAADELALMLPAMAGMVRDMTAQKEIMRAATLKGFLTATDLADALVRRFAVPFREAHHITGHMVRMAEEKNCRLDELSLEDMQTIEPRLDKDIFNVLKPEKAVASRISYGGTAPSCVRAQVKAWRKKIG